MEKLLTRAELYEMVWARPATKVGAELGISGVALGKICRRHEVPVSERGHWAKLAAGKPVRTVRLPTVTDPRLEEIRILGSAIERLPAPVLAARDQAVALEAQAAAADKPEHRSQAKASPYVDRLANKLRGARPQKDGFVHLSAQQLFPVMVSPACVERALLALERIITTTLARGYDLKPTDAGLVLVITREPVSLSLSETTKKLPHQPTPAEVASLERWEDNHKRKIARGDWSSAWDKPKIPEHDVIPSGLLMVEIDRSSGYDGIRRKFSDGKQQRIENMADKIVTTAAVCAAAAIERSEEAARRERERAEMEKRRKEAERRHTLEKKRWEFLQAKMQRLERAQQISGFVSDYRHLFPEDTLPASCQSLLRWASAVANSVLEEVSPARLALLLDKYQLMDDATSIDSWVKVTGD